MGNLKVGDAVWILDMYEPIEKVIKEIYEDYEHNESDFKIKWVTVSDWFGSRVGEREERLEDVYESEREARWHIQGKKDAYDRYVTSRY